MYRSSVTLQDLEESCFPTLVTGDQGRFSRDVSKNEAQVRFLLPAKLTGQIGN